MELSIDDPSRPTLNLEPPVADGPLRPAEPKTHTWSIKWRGWDGLHLEVNRKSLLGQWIPGVTNVSSLNPESALWFLGKPELTAGDPRNPLTFHLDRTQLTANIGAKFAVDAATYADDEIEKFEDGVELRRARLYARGDCLLLLPVSYELEVGYIPGQFYIENSYVQFRNLGFLGVLKIGQYQAPMSLVNSGSSRDMMFMEAAAPLQALAAGVEAGIQLGQPVFGRRMTWAFGMFTEGVENDVGDATEDFGRAIARITGLAIDRPHPDNAGSPQLLHLGLSAYLLYSGSDSVRYQSRPESHMAPYLIDTGSLDADAAGVLGVEGAWVDGPLCIQAEYLHARVRRNEAPMIDFAGLYASVSWFLTGESRPYDREQGTFARVIPRRNFAPGKGGWGAIEIASRFSYTDLNSDDVSGGRLSMGMLGANWYLHSHLKWRFNYGVGNVDSPAGRDLFHLLQSRVEVDF